MGDERRRERKYGAYQSGQTSKLLKHGFQTTGIVVAANSTVLVGVNATSRDK